MLDGAPLRLGDPMHRDPEGWLPGGEVLIDPQVLHVLTAFRIDHIICYGQLGVILPAGGVPASCPHMDACTLEQARALACC